MQHEGRVHEADITYGTIKPLNENKRNIIAALIEEYDIETADDIQDALKDLLGGTIKSMMESEMDEHLGYENYERSDNDNYRNGTKRKTVRSNYVEFQIDVPLRGWGKVYGEFAIMYEGRIPL